MVKSSSSVGTHPFFIFWLGVLTGAILVGLIFSYQAYRVVNLQNAILNGEAPAYWEEME